MQISKRPMQASKETYSSMKESYTNIKEAYTNIKETCANTQETYAGIKDVKSHTKNRPKSTEKRLKDKNFTVQRLRKYTRDTQDLWCDCDYLETSGRLCGKNVRKRDLENRPVQIQKRNKESVARLQLFGDHWQIVREKHTEKRLEKRPVHIQNRSTEFAA